MRKCRFCAEEIQDAARVCKHCGRDLTGREPAPRVTVAGIEPFAEFHTPIRGKAAGELTGIGVAGIVLGVFFVVMAPLAMTARNGGLPGLMFALIGVGFGVASYLWARRPVVETGRPVATPPARRSHR